MKIKFADGTQFDLCATPRGADVVVAGHKRDVLTVTVTGDFTAVKKAFGDSQRWAVVDGENTYDKSNYTLLASVCDNMDGTVTVRVGRANTREEDLENAKKALQAENAALSAQVDDLLVEVLEGGAADV